MAPEIYTLMRWLHIIAGSAWFGEVIVINFVLIPALSTYQGAARKDFMHIIFPRLFNLASMLAASTAISGGFLLYNFVGLKLSQLAHRGTWGWSILIAGTLGLVLTIFHFFVENHLSKKVGKASHNISEQTAEDIHLKMKIVPRIGLLVLTIIFLLMLNASHRLFGF